MAKSTAMPTNSTPKPTEIEVERADGGGGEQQCERQPEHQREQDRHDQPPGASTARKSQSVISTMLPEQADGRPFGDGREFLIGERHVAGDRARAPARIARRAVPRRPGRIALVAAPPGCSAPKSSLGWASTKTYLPAEIGQPAAQQLLPRQRLRVAVQRALDRRGEAAQHRIIGREVGLALRRAHAEQRRARRTSPRARGIGDELAQERLRRDQMIGQVGSCLGSRNSNPSLAKNGEASGRVTLRKLALSRLQLRGQRGRRAGRLLRLARVDHHHQQIVELREVRANRSAACRQGRRLENISSVSVLTPRCPAAKRQRQHGGHEAARQRRRARAAAADVHHADEQASERHAGRGDSASRSAGPPAPSLCGEAICARCLRPGTEGRMHGVRLLHGPCRPAATLATAVPRRSCRQPAAPEGSWPRRGRRTRPGGCPTRRCGRSRIAASSAAIARQEEIGLRAATDGEYPPRLLALRFRLRAGRRRDLRAGAEDRSSRAPTLPHALRVTGRIALLAAGDGGPFPVSRRSRAGGGAEADDPVAERWCISAAAAARSTAAAYPELDGVLRRSGRAYHAAVQGFAAAGCRYLQLDEVYIAYLCDPEQVAGLKARGEHVEDLLGTSMPT